MTADSLERWSEHGRPTGLEDLNMDEEKIFALVVSLENVGSLCHDLLLANNDLNMGKDANNLRALLETQKLHLEFEPLPDGGQIAASSMALGAVAMGVLNAVAQIKGCDLQSAQSILAGMYEDEKNMTTLEKVGVGIGILATAALAIATFGASLSAEGAMFAGSGFLIGTVSTAEIASGSLAGIEAIIAIYEKTHNEIDTFTLVKTLILSTAVFAGGLGVLGKVTSGLNKAENAAEATAGLATASTVANASEMVNIAKMTAALNAVEGTEKASTLLKIHEIIEEGRIAGLSYETIIQHADKSLVGSTWKKFTPELLGLDPIEFEALTRAMYTSAGITGALKTGAIPIVGATYVPNVQGTSVSVQDVRLDNWIKVHNSDSTLVSPNGYINYSKGPPDLVQASVRYNNTLYEKTMTSWLDQNKSKLSIDTGMRYATINLESAPAPLKEMAMKYNNMVEMKIQGQFDVR